ncbi:MAG: hypothetical protein QW273_02025 [Candidatus Pacearchaeota archaeon]
MEGLVYKERYYLKRRNKSIPCVYLGLKINNKRKNYVFINLNNHEEIFLLKEFYLENKFIITSRIKRKNIDEKEKGYLEEILKEYLFCD